MNKEKTAALSHQLLYVGQHACALHVGKAGPVKNLESPLFHNDNTSHYFKVIFSPPSKLRPQRKKLK
jgi:hypothetical protein